MLRNATKESYLTVVYRLAVLAYVSPLAAVAFEQSVQVLFEDGITPHCETFRLRLWACRHTRDVFSTLEIVPMPPGSDDGQERCALEH